MSKAVFSMKDLYNSDPDFKSYVDKYCRSYKIPVDEALSHELVKQVALYYKEG